MQPPLGRLARPLGPLLLHFTFQQSFLHKPPLHLHHRHCRRPMYQRQWHNCFWISRVSSIPPSSCLQQSMMYNITSRMWGRHCPPDFAVLRVPNSRWPELSSTRWRRTALCATPPACGHPLSTWYPRRMVPGGLAVIFRRLNLVTEPDCYPSTSS